MTHESSEIRSAIAQKRAEVRAEKALQVAFESGQMARLAGEPESACAYRRPDRRNAWLRGWNEADQQLSEAEASRLLSTAERDRGLKALAELRAKLPFLGRGE